MIEVYKDTKIYVVAPSGLVTGGPEILHSLVHNLREELGIEAFIYYYPRRRKKVVEEYSDYTVSLTNEIVDDKKNVVVLPEVVNFLEFGRSFARIRKVVYWLSVDFFYQSMFYRTLRGFFMGVINKINVVSLQMFNKTFLPHFDVSYEAIRRYSNLDLKSFYLLSDIYFHLTQGVRIAEFLKERGLENVSRIGDYINKDFINNDYDPGEKENIVCYNPRKGFEFTSKVIKYCRSNKLGINFVPIVGMNRKGVISLLRRSKVYIDFSNFPGRERLPREAVVLGCCVITGKRGSAKYFEDVPIPENYKIEDKLENIPEIVTKIQECLDNYDERVKDFEISREFVRREPEEYVKNLRRVFVRV